MTPSKFCTQKYFLNGSNLSKNDVHIFNACAITVQSLNNVVKKTCNYRLHKLGTVHSRCNEILGKQRHKRNWQGKILYLNTTTFSL